MVSGTCRSYVSKRYKCVRKRTDGKRVPPPSFCDHFLSKNDQQTIQQINKKTLPTNMAFDAKGVPKRNTNKSMPKPVPKQIRTNIKIHVSLNGENIALHCKNKCCCWFTRLHVRTVKGIKKTSKMKPKSINKSMKHRYKNNARKRSSQKMKHHQKSDPKRM